MRKTLAVAWREFKHTVMRPVFVLAVLGLPVLMIGLIVVAALVFSQHKEPPLVGAVVVIEQSGDVAQAAEIEFDEASIRDDERREQQEQIEQMTTGSITMTPGNMQTMPAQRGEVRITVESQSDTTEIAIDAARARLMNGELLAVIVVSPDLLESIAHDPGEDNARGSEDDPAAKTRKTSFDLFVGEDMDSDHISLIERRMGEAIVRVRAQRAGYDDPEEIIALLQRPRATTSRAKADGEVVEESEGMREMRRYMVPMAFMILVWIGVFSSSQNLLMSTIEEKSNRVMEVLLSAVSPLQLMAGKILGYGAVGLLIVGIYCSVGIAGIIALAAFSDFLHWTDLLYLGIFYLMAYFMIASLMAAVGSAVSDIREANTLVTPVMMILMVPWMLWMPISQAPNGAIATTFSFIPPAAPFAMIIRMAGEEPIPPIQMALAIAWGYLCVLIMIWAAAKIFRIGVLMTGKPPSPLQLLKWIRYS